METQIHPTEMSQGENDYEEALERLTSTIVEKIGEGAQKTKSFFFSACIYRVPEELRKLKESAYSPRLIAIGPLHRNDKHLQTPLQHVKMSYMDYLLSRLTAGMEDLELAGRTKFTVVRKCLAEMKTLIDDAKKCYAEDVTLDEEMMLVDGCFILEFLYRYHNGTSERQDTDPIFGTQLTLCNVKNDLVTLENQIPFFVLEKLFQLTVGEIQNRFRYKKLTLTHYLRLCYYGRMIRPLRISNKSGSAKTWCSPNDCVLRVFGNKLKNSKEEEEEEEEEEEDLNTKYYHILHNLQDGYLPRDQTIEKEYDSEEVPMPSASELKYAGVKFVPAASGNNLFKFEFTEPKGLFWWCRRAHFVIPPLPIYDHTELFMRNLIAMEQFCLGVSNYVTSYAFVMDMLVNSDKDVQVLEKAGVMLNCLGASEDATYLFNNLCKEIICGRYFAETCIKATEYSKRFWPKNMAHVRRTYFASPWTFIAFCVGLIAFVMSAIQFARDFLKKG